MVPFRKNFSPGGRGYHPPARRVPAPLVSLLSRTCCDDLHRRKSVPMPDLLPVHDSGSHVRPGGGWYPPFVSTWWGGRPPPEKNMAGGRYPSGKILAGGVGGTTPPTVLQIPDGEHAYVFWDPSTSDRRWCLNCAIAFFVPSRGRTLSWYPIVIVICPRNVLVTKQVVGM